MRNYKVKPDSELTPVQLVRREKYLKNREKFVAANRAWALAHPERMHEIQQAWNKKQWADPTLREIEKKRHADYARNKKLRSINQEHDKRMAYVLPVPVRLVSEDEWNRL